MSKVRFRQIIVFSYDDNKEIQVTLTVRVIRNFEYRTVKNLVLHDLDTSEEERAPNRLIVLDEFGAFVAHDLLYQLEVWLRAWVDEHPGDQLLIVLPLSQDYAERANHTLGPEAETFRDLAAQVSTRRYAVRELSQ